jgi:lysophospholipase L1-like esterase
MRELRIAMLALMAIGCSSKSTATGGGTATGGTSGGDNGPIWKGNVGSTTGDGGSGSANADGSTSTNTNPNGNANANGGSSSGGGGVMTAAIGTYIPLGDSISDLGGTGPFFYDLLLHNDDTTYPALSGHDLATRFPGITYDHRALAGSITDNYANPPLIGPTLKSQIDLLGSDYPGDVLVTITIGGNDLNEHSAQELAGSDAPGQMEFSQHLADELAELTAPGRLGSGHVYVVVANIYDFTDGQGDFATVLCGPPVNMQPAQDATIFAAWNGILQSAVANAGGILYDMHADFMGHGFQSSDVWYDRISCIHPNATGHDHIRRAIWKLVTGEVL